MANNREADADSTALSTTLSRLSINPASLPLPDSPATQMSQKSATSGKDPDTPAQSKKRPPKVPSRRSSGITKSQTLPRSPKPTGNSSGAMEKPIKIDTPSTVTTQPTEALVAPSDLPAAQSHVSTEVRPTTAASLASDLLKKELESHAASDNNSDTIVIVHDACYGHRYSRRKTSKANLGLIVERPERIQAGVLGLSSAYVRLGGKYAGEGSGRGQSNLSKSTTPFIIRKTTRSVPLRSPAVTNVHGASWMEELITMCNMAESRLATGAKELIRTEKLDETPPKPHLHEGDLYLCQESLNAFQGALGGVFDGVDAVFKTSHNNISRSTTPKKAFVCVRPPGHHCSADLPSGFCWLNNVHVGIEYAAQTYGLTHAAIIDFDLHHGDGSQAIAWERNTRAADMPKNAPMSKRISIGYFSLHDINSYPCEYGDVEKVQNASLCIENAHGQSIWNVHLQPWKTEAEFWDLYRTRYAILLDKARAFLRTQTQHVRAMPANVTPKSAIFISAGFDASEWEGEGMQRHKVNVPTEFYAKFTSDIARLAEEEGTGVEGRIISVMEGGYSNRALTSGVLSHLTGLVGSGASENIETVNMENSSTFSNHWWSAELMTELENLVMGVQVPSRKARTSEPTFHATPTESFLAKVVDPAKVQRKPPVVQPTNSQAPNVDWATATHELSKLLIPNDRQINSCRHEDLAEPRAKRDRQSVVGLPPIDAAGDRMLLRGRKSKAFELSDSTTTDGVALPLRALPKKSRKSIATDLSVLTNERPVASTAFSESTLQSQVDTIVSTPVPSVEEKTPVVEAQKLSPISKPSKAMQSGTKVHRTRRVSGAQVNLLQDYNDSKPPPVPAIPTQYSSGSRKSTPQPSKPAGEPIVIKPLESNTDLDKLAAGVKRITLKHSPREGQKTEVKSTSTNEDAPKVVKKSTAQKLQKDVSKSSVPKGSKVSKAAPSLPLSTGPTASGVPVPSVITPQHPTTSVPDIPLMPAICAPDDLAAVPQVDVKQQQDISSKIDDDSDQWISSDRQTLYDTVISRETDIPPSIATFPETGNLLNNSVSLDTGFFTNDDAATNSETSSWIRLTSQSPPLATTNHSTPIQARSLHSASEDESFYTTPATHIRPRPTPPTVEPSAQASGQNFIPYIPPPGQTNQGHQVSAHAPAKPDTLTWLPPNSDMPAQSPTKTAARQLPVFTAESHIPFGAPRPPKAEGVEAVDEVGGDGRVGVGGWGAVRAGAGANANVEADFWEVPMTPAKR